jgi:hypothetical protein
MLYTSMEKEEELGSFFDLPFKAVSLEQRKKDLKRLARNVNRSFDRTVWKTVVPPDAFVVLRPEGYGKSQMIKHLIAHGMKVVFCVKSNAQASEKERSMESWGMVVTRFASKRANLLEKLSELGISIRVVERHGVDPYAESMIDKEATIKLIAESLELANLPLEAEALFNQHFESHKPKCRRGADVVLTTLSSFQSCINAERPAWWERFGLVKRYKTVRLESSGKDVVVPIPYDKIVVVIDDPDREDFDWLRPVSNMSVPKLLRSMEPIAQPIERVSGRMFPPTVAAQVREERAKQRERLSESVGPLYLFKNRYYAQRPVHKTIGHKIREPYWQAKLLVTTTEWFTGYLALKTFARQEHHAFQEVDVFRTTDCNVTLISSVITRKRDHAVLLPMIEQLRQEFPGEQIELIADGLASKFTLSNSKGRNDLQDATTIIKLSWPHPEVIATLGAHVGRVDYHDLMIATLLADLANQAIGRNQGFRYRGKEAIVLVDPRYFPPLIRHKLIRYRLNPWSSTLPSFNRQLSKRAGIEAVRYVGEHTALQGRLLQMIANFDSFGRSPEARTAAERLEATQRAKYDEWLAMREEPPRLARESARAEKRREQVKESVRRHRQKGALAG